MSESPKHIPRVGIHVMRNGRQSFGRGYLAYRDGQYWCFQSETDTDKAPRDAGALLLDPSLLEPQPTPDLDAPLYEYREIFDIS